MADLAPYTDAEDAVMDALGDIAPAVAWTGTDTAEDLPVFRVRRIGGPDDRVTDAARVAVAALAATTAQAKALAEAARQRLTSGPLRTPSGVIDRAATEVGPQAAPTADPDRVRAREAIYRVYLRR
ncbi:hypothetical protein [Allonocardiopsis opalescens]|uniref:Uncharacterized protein n=1 Tax=Allonocardiopsis opalescens TaxID=1144618 RepID=A0A2T0PVL6_9ACTN|nr:hypothetical protein [Allonocardiopsis opalescens]PRX95572.1 hypothetical protein CLV72_109181 [Allonocardiopsis opalescens]